MFLRLSLLTHFSFHCDEAFACALLKALPEYTNVSICRTRDREMLKTGCIVVDVGQLFNHSERRYDHHQNEFTETFETANTKLSSAGLIYQYYGKRVIQTLMPTLSVNEVNVLHD